MGEGVAILGIHDGVIELVQVPAKHVCDAGCTDDLNDRTEGSAEPDEGCALSYMKHPIVN